jgi:hypothetical protein
VDGPREPGHWTATLHKRHLGFLKAGERYRVRVEFVDFDGDVHPVGEEWAFLGSSFLPYEDGLSLFVSLDGSREWHIRMQWRPEAQGEIIDGLSRYVEAV